MKLSHQNALSGISVPMIRAKDRHDIEAVITSRKKLQRQNRRMYNLTRFNRVGKKGRYK